MVILFRKLDVMVMVIRVVVCFICLIMFVSNVVRKLVLCSMLFNVIVIKVRSNV